MGYSMTAGYRIAAELLRELRPDTPVDIVNRTVGDTSDPTSPAGRAASLEFMVEGQYQGADAVADYVSARVSDAANSLVDRPELSSPAEASVVIAVHLEGMNRGPHSFVVRTTEGKNVGCSFDRAAPAKEDKSPNELGYRSLPSGTTMRDEFMTAATMQDQLKRHGKVVIEIDNREYVGIDVKRATIGGWPVLNLVVVPA